MGVSTTTWAYVVKNGDTLSSIAYKNISAKVYGKDGSINKILALNPQIKNPNRIFPGQYLELEKVETFAVTENKDQEPREPAALETPIQENLQQEFSRFELAGVLGQSRLDAKDSTTSAKSVMSSRFSPEVSAKWTQHWDSGFISFLSGKVRRDSFETTASSQTLTKANPILLDFELGAQVFKLDKVHVDLALGYEQSPFARGVTATTFTVDTVSVPKIHASAQVKLKESNTFFVSTKIGAKYLAPVKESSFDVKSGYGYDLGIFIEHKRSKNPFFGGVTFSQNQQDSSIAKQSYTNVGLMFGFKLDIMGDSR